MPITRYIGRTTLTYEGKSLFHILYRLKNFGIGRIVYRNSFMKRYPEPSYYIITKVFPDPSNPTGSHLSRVQAIEIWRGDNLGEKSFPSCYKPDWRLVPHAEEEELLNCPHNQRQARIISESMPLPPLVEFMTRRERVKAGLPDEKPLMKRVIKENHIAMLQSEADLLDLEESKS